MPTPRKSTTNSQPNYEVSDDEDYDDLNELVSEGEDELQDDEDVKPSKSILEGALKKPIHSTLSTKQLYQMLQAGQVELCPEYQREVVWPVSKMIGLISSVMLNYYMPPIIFAVETDNVTNDVKYTAIDGKQRCTSIVKFYNGEIPFASPDGNRYYYRKEQGGRGRLLPAALKQRFELAGVVVVEYSDVPDDTQRELFKRVQLGVTLTSAEKLQAIASPYATYVSELLKKYFTHDGTLKNLIKFDQKRARAFQTVTAIIMWCLNPASVSSISLKRMQTFLDRSDQPDLGFKKKMNETMSIVVRLATRYHSQVFDLGMYKNKKTERVSPVELWFVGFIVYTRMNASSLSGLAKTIQDMRFFARDHHKDLFTNPTVIGSINGWLQKYKVIPPGPSESVAAVEWETEDPQTTEVVARKRRREAQEEAEDPDYRGTPVARGSKSDVVGNTRSRGPAILTSSGRTIEDSPSSSRVNGTTTSGYVKTSITASSTQSVRPPPTAMDNRPSRNAFQQNLHPTPVPGNPPGFSGANAAQDPTLYGQRMQQPQQYQQGYQQPYQPQQAYQGQQQPYQPQSNQSRPSWASTSYQPR